MSEPISPETTTPSQKRALTAALESELESLQEDLRQAALDYERQLTEKTEESHRFQSLLQKTRTDLADLEESIVELRRERHFLANEVMRGAQLEIHLTRLTEENDTLKKELERTREALRAAEGAVRQSPSGEAHA
jgi:chromosome segregation ATPase